MYVISQLYKYTGHSAGSAVLLVLAAVQRLLIKAAPSM